MTFIIDKNIEIKSSSVERPEAVYQPGEGGLPLVNYNYSDLSKMVSFFLEKINAIPEDPNKKIGVVHNLLDVMGAAWQLAIIKSGRDYIVVYCNEDKIPTWLDQYCSHVFIVGREGQDSNYHDLYSGNDFYTSTEDYAVRQQLLAHDRYVDLNFEFSKDQKTYIIYFNATKPVLAFKSGIVEASSVQAAMDNYFHEDDIVGLNRPLKHIGVNTVSLLPALFKCRKVYLLPNWTYWELGCADANNIHIGWQMITQNWVLPKKLRVLSTGGYSFTNEYLQHVKSKSDVEHVIDCYGTSTAPPPLAIRELNVDDRSVKPFTWINKLISPVSKEGKLHLVTSVPGLLEGVDKAVNDELPTGDQIELLDNNQFFFFGSWQKYIRVNHRRWELPEFQSYFLQETGISDYQIEYEKTDGEDFPCLIFEQKHKEIVEEFLTKNSVECKIKIQ